MRLLRSLKRNWPFAVIGLLLGLLCTSCTDEQIARAKDLSDRTDQKLAQANAAVALAEQAVARAKAIADQLGSEQAQRIVGQAETALEQVKGARDIVATTDLAVHSALDAATGTQAAGGSSLGVILAAAGGAVPGILAALAALSKWIGVMKSYRQTVTGLDAAKEALAANPATAKTWDDHIAPELDAAHDEKTRRLVATIQAKAA